MACTAIDRRGAVLTRGVLITVHDLYGGPWLMKPMESYLHSYRNFQVQPFRFRPRHQVICLYMDTHDTGDDHWLTRFHCAQDLAASGKELSELLKSQKPHTSDDAVHFVTHGYGALVLREAFRHIDWNYTKSKVVMIAPPNRGIRYYRSMKKHVGVAGYGGIAAEELAKWTAEDIDQRLGKLPRRCYPLVLSGSLCLNPFNQGNYPNDGLVMVEETTLPGEFRHEVVAATHYTMPVHPAIVHRIQSFLEA